MIGLITTATEVKVRKNWSDKMPKNIFIAAAAYLLTVGASWSDPVGNVEINIGSMAYSNTDDVVSDTLGFAGLNADLSTNYEEYLFTFDFSYLHRDVQAGVEFEDFAPEDVFALGVHAGKKFADTYVGGFVGKNRFQGFDSGSANGYVMGNIMGVEAVHEMQLGRLFAQYGDAEMVGDTGDTAFDGNYYRVGMDFDLRRGDLLFSYERGTSDAIFEDPGDYGSYERIEIIYEYPFSDRLVGVMGADLVYVDANIEDASAETNWSIGLRMPFGEQKRRNLLRTPYMPGLAAAWAETLDGIF